MSNFKPAQSINLAVARTRANALIAVALVATGTVGLLVGCGGGGAAQPPAPTQTAPTAPTAPSAPAAVALSPGDTTLAVGAKLPLLATQSGATDSDVVWSVNGIAGGSAAVGTITGTGGAVTYTAPTAVGSYTITVACPENLSNNASATLTVLAAGTVIVNLTPATASVNTGGTTAITASVTGNSNTAVAWTVDGIANGNATVGTITGTGATATYTAPAAAGSHTVTATSAADPSKSATTTVTVQAAVSGAVSVSMNPPTATLNAGGTTAITATVSGNSNTAVTWTVDGIANGNATVGLLAGSGNTMTYTAPAAAGSHTVTATSAANPASSSTTVISVQVSTGTSSITLSNSGPASVNTSGSVLFTAAGTGSSNSAITWSVDGVAGGNSSVGTITGGSGNEALYVAPPATGSHTITAASGGASTSKAIAVNSTAYTIPNAGKIVKVGSPSGGNDAPAIQSAISSASSAGGGIVEIPAGTYLIASQDTGGISLASNVYLQIDAGATLKMLSASGTSNMIMISGANNCGIIGSGTIDGNRGAIGTNEGIELVTIWGTTGAVISGVTIQNSPGDGIYLNGYPSGAGVGSPVSNVLIYGVTVTNNGRNGMSPDGCDGLIVRDCTFSNHVTANPMNGIDCEPINNQKPNNFLIFHNVFSGNTGGGIQSGPDDSGDNATFTNMTYAFNTVTNNGNYGLEAQDGSGPVLIMNNTISNTTSSYEFGGYGIMTRGSSGISNVTIMGNSVTTSHSDGIYISAATSTTCTYNTVTSSSGKGINNTCGATVSNNTESGNSGGN